MTAARLTARARLTLLLSLLFALGGGAILTANYLLVAANLTSAVVRTPANDPRFLATCGELLQSSGEVDRTMAEKCASTLTNGVVAAAEAQRSEVLGQLLLDSTVILVVIVAVVAFAAWLLAGRILRPIRQITDAARAAGDDLSHGRLALTGPKDELRQLGDTFDSMLDRLDASFRSQQQFAANASHELRTPLAVMTTTVDVVLAKPHPTREDLLGMGRDVRTAAVHANGLVDTLLELARSDAGVLRRSRVDLAELTERMMGRAREHSLRVIARLEPAVVAGDERLLERLESNLLGNAIQHNIAGGEVVIETGVRDGVAFLRIENTGPPVAEDEVVEIFQRFARLSGGDESDGYGLGLSLVQSVAEAHQGAVTAWPRVGGGLVVKVTLPADAPDGS